MLLGHVEAGPRVHKAVDRSAIGRLEGHFFDVGPLDIQKLREVTQ